MKGSQKNGNTKNNQSATTENMREKLQFIEGIRGFAALIVIFQHLVLMFYPTLYTGTVERSHFLDPAMEHQIAISPLSIFYNGNFAVCLFFVLSGFVLSYNYFQTNNSRLLLEASIKRYFRLLIPIAFSIVFTIVLIAIFRPNTIYLEKFTYGGDWLKGLFSEKPTFFGVLYNMFIDVFVTGNNKYNPVLWTMGIEFLGSVLLFAVLMLSHSVRKKGIVLLAMALFLTFSGYYFYSAFFLGALISFGFVQKTDEQKPKIWLNIVLLVFGLYFGSYPTSWQYLKESIYLPLQFFEISLMNFSLVLGSALLIFLASRSQIFQKVFSLAIFRFLGKISFSSYLIHLVIVLIVSCSLFPWFIQSFSYPKSFLLCALISISITYAISWLVYKLIDKPSVKLSNLISRKTIEFLNK